MKNKGKLFNKIHVLDILIAIVFLFVVFTGYVKLSGTDVIDLGSGSDVKIRYEITTSGYDPLYLEHMMVGDLIAEDKKFLDGEIIRVDIVDKLVTFVDNNGDTITGSHPSLKKAVIVIEATAEYKNPIYKVGKQEVREGMHYFVTTEFVNLSGIISQIEIIE